MIATQYWGSVGMGECVQKESCPFLRCTLLQRRSVRDAGRHFRLLKWHLPLACAEKKEARFASVALPQNVEARLLFFVGESSTFLGTPCLFLDDMREEPVPSTFPFFKGSGKPNGRPSTCASKEKK